jgi:ribosomal protein L33
MPQVKRVKNQANEFFSNPLVRTGIVISCAVLLDIFYLKSKNLRNTANKLVQNIFKELAGEKGQKI